MLQLLCLKWNPVGDFPRVRAWFTKVVAALPSWQKYARILDKMVTGLGGIGCFDPPRAAL